MYFNYKFKQASKKVTGICLQTLKTLVGDRLCNFLKLRSSEVGFPAF